MARCAYRHATQATWHCNLAHTAHTHPYAHLCRPAAWRACAVLTFYSNATFFWPVATLSAILPCCAPKTHTARFHCATTSGWTHALRPRFVPFHAHTALPARRLHATPAPAARAHVYSLTACCHACSFTTLPHHTIPATTCTHTLHCHTAVP